MPEVNTQQSINSDVMKTLSIVATKSQAEAAKAPVIINNNNVTNNNVAGGGNDKAAPKVVDNNVYFLGNIAATVAMNRVMNRSL